MKGHETRNDYDGDTHFSQQWLTYKSNCVNVSLAMDHFLKWTVIRVFGIDNKAGKNRIDSISERDDGHFLNHFGWMKYLRRNVRITDF